MLTRLAALSLVTLLVLCAQAGTTPDPANAEPTGLAVVACENIAAYLDGDPNNGTLPAEEDLACLQAIPPTGAVSIQALAGAVGDTDGILEQTDLANIDLLDHNRIDETCTYQAVVLDATKPAMGCTLLVFLFVDDEKPVALDTSASLGSIEAGGPADFLCIVDGTALGQDADCSDVPLGNGDGIVLFRLLNVSGTNGHLQRVGVAQEAVEYSGDIRLSNKSRNDPAVDLDPDLDGVQNQDDNCPDDINSNQLNTDADPIATAGIGPLDISVANADQLGDVCDFDDDNDSFQDFIEVNLRPFDAYHALCLHAPEDTNPVLGDTDGDRILDRAECILGSDPLDPNAKPPLVLPDTDGDGLSDAFEDNNGFDPNAADSDGDAMPDGLEYKSYNTAYANDTDGDGCSDGLEITSMDTNQTVNSLDLLIVALSFNQTNRPNPDINKNGIVNATDLLIVALNFGAVCNTPD